MTVRDAITGASRAIARRDAEVLLLEGLGRDRAWLLAHAGDPLSEAEGRAFEARVGRRAAGEPLQYVTGRQEFYGLDLRVGPGVLIPRPETEILVEAVLAWAGEQATPPTRIADVGTGSGAIALALATHLPEARVTALDLSPAALEIARANAERLQLTERVRFVASDLLAGVPAEGDRFDVVASNPPYVRSDDARTLAREVRDFEPHMALFAGPDGMEVYRRLIPEAWAALRPGGLLALEFGFGQREALAGLLGNWSAVRFLDDLAGIPRTALATRP